MLVNQKRLQTALDVAGLDGLVAATLENVQYFTGVRSISLEMFPHDGQCYAVLTRDRPTVPSLVASTGEIDQVLDGYDGIGDTVIFGTFYRELPDDDLQLTADEQKLKAMAVDSEPQPGPLEGMIEALRRLGLANQRIGVDELGLRAGFREQLAEKLPQAGIKPASELIRWVRRVKTDEEVRRLRTSAQITEKAILAAAGIAREGVTERELALEFRQSIARQGASPGFSLIRFGRNAIAGQVRPDSTPLKPGDTIWFDVGCRYEGYWSDVARNFSLGAPGPRTQKIYRAMLEGETQAIAAARPGMTGGELFNLTIKATRQAGASHYRRHHVGHGIGSEVYEQPLLAPDVGEVIEAGMVLNIETPYYEFGLGALHVEDPFLVGENGNNELLTTLGRELHIIDR